MNVKHTGRVTLWCAPPTQATPADSSDPERLARSKDLRVGRFERLAGLKDSCVGFCDRFENLVGGMNS